MTNQTYIASKPRYEILDGLRGVAAMLVVVYHLLETYFHGAPDQPLNHGYLAVDFFFMLSGFVIGYAYDDRWDRMSLWSFAKRRLIRLHPMLILGTLIGAALYYFGSSSDFPIIGQTPWYILVGITLWAATLLPIPTTLDIRGVERNQSSQRTGMVTAMGISGQYTLYGYTTQVFHSHIGRMCCSICRTDGASVFEY